MTFTIRVREVMWFATGAMVALLVAWVLLSAWRVEAAPGDSDATFVPVSACRLADTRPAPNRIGTEARFDGEETKVFDVHGTNGKCTVPADAVGVSLNVTAVNASLTTFLTVWPEGARPQASSLNPIPGAPPTPNAVTTSLTSSGQFNVYNRQGNVDVIIDLNGYYTKSSLEDLAARVIELEALTASMSLTSVDGQPVVRFSGVNVQVVDGTGTTDDSPNGRGNVIVGYHESVGGQVRTGSHNLVVGVEHGYTGSGGVVFGSSNKISGNFATVTGGAFNAASGTNSTVAGGSTNTAIGSHAAIVGGVLNEADGAASSILGGELNDTIGSRSTIAGGYSNATGGSYSAISGGRSNGAGGNYATVVGGESNGAGGDYDVAVGGFANSANGPRAVAVGGGENTATGSKSVVSGGSKRASTGTFDWRAGTLFQNE